jgi:peptidoglycan DL-endopeptidase CwlO
MQKNIKTISKKTSFKSRHTVAFAVVAVLLISVVAAPYFAQADSLNDEINRLKSQNAANKAAVTDLKQVAVSYQDAISKLESQIAGLQGQIDANEAEKAKLEQQILETKLELGRQKAVLGQTIKTMYVDKEMSTIEMLATSKNLGDFVDKETYRNAVQRKVQETMGKITALQNELNDKKKQIDDLLALLGAQRNEIESNRAQQAQLLAMNKQQQAEYNEQTKNNLQAINDLQRKIDEQTRLNSQTRYTDGGIYFIRFPGNVSTINPGSYTYKNAGFSMSPLPGCGNPDPRTGERDATDAWGYCTRQCVSFTAWAVEASGRTAPRNYGHAKNWVNRAPSSYIYRTPQAGDIAITTSGDYGHAMYVESVSGNTMRVYEYNQQLNGQLRTDRTITWR